MVAGVFLKLADESGCEPRLLIEVDVLLPLLVEENVGVLEECRGKPLDAEPFAESCLKGEVVPGFGGKERAVHVGI